MGHRGHQGAVRGVRDVRGVLWGWQGVKVLRGQMGIGGIRGHWGLLGAVGHQGAIRGCQGVRGCIGGWHGDSRGVRGIGVASGLGAQPHWTPVQGPSTPTGSPLEVTYLTKARQGPLSRVPSLPLGVTYSLGDYIWGVTYLAKAKQVTEMNCVGYYIHLELYLVTVCTFVSMLPNYIFLHM